MSALKALASLFFALLVAACASTITVSAVFSDPRGLDTGVPVFRGETKVGEVASLNVAGGYTEAELSLDPELAAGLLAGSAALLTTRDGATVIELYNYRSGEQPLKSGDELTGLSNPMEYAAWQAAETMDTGKQSLEEMTKSIADYFSSEEWRQQKQQMNRRLAELEDEMGRAYEETSKAYEEFMQNLESESESARERAEESYAELVRSIRNQIAELKARGNEKLVEPLQRLLEEFTRALEKKPEQREV